MLFCPHCGNMLLVEHGVRLLRVLTALLYQKMQSILIFYPTTNHHMT